MPVPSSPDGAGSPQFELIETARYQLQALSESLLRLGLQLDINEVPADRWGPVVRTLRLLDGLSGRNLIAVAGEQGAGKTHLLTNLYPAAAGWLEGNIGRGEKTAVAVQERAGCTQARGIVVRRRRWDRHGRKTDNLPSEGLTYEVAYTFDRREQWRAAVTGEDSDVVLVILEMPLGFLGADGWGFALLPGFERVRDTAWQHLMKLVLATSPAALVVVDGAGLADRTQAEILASLRRAGGQAMEFVVAVSRCEEVRSPGILAQRIRRAMEVYGARESDVIPVGRTVSDPASWPERLHAALGRIRVTSAQSHRLEAALLREVVRDDVMGVVNLARAALDSAALRNDVASEIDEYMSIFDRACGKLRRDLAAEVREAFGGHHRAAVHRLETSLEGTGWKDFARRRVDWVQMQSGAWAARLTAAVDDSWNPGQAQQIQQAVIGEVAGGMWRAYGQEFQTSLSTPGQGQAALALLSGHRQAEDPDDSPGRPSLPDTAPASRAVPEATVQAHAGLGPTLRVLPGAVLQARALALRLAAPDGQILAVPDERTLTEIMYDVAGVQRQLLTALTVVAGDAEHPDTPGGQAEGTNEPAEATSQQAEGTNEPAEATSQQAEGPSEMLASLTQIVSDAREFRPIVRRLLAGPAAKTGMGAVAGASAAVAEEAAAAGASAAGAAAGTAAGTGAAGVAAGTALTAALTAAGVAAAAAMVIQAGNRAVRERDQLAYARLIEWRTATEASILTNAEELLRRTRDIVYGRLWSALGADSDLDRNFRLRQAIEDVRRDRALMLETLRDGHLG